MSLDDQLRSVLNAEADVRTGPPLDVPGLIRGGQARRRRRHAAWAGGSVLAAVIAAGGMYGVAQLGDDAAGSAEVIAGQPTPQALPSSEIGVPIEAGTYVAGGQGEVAPYAVTVPDGWTGVYGDTVAKHWDGPGPIEIYPFALEEIGLFDDACKGPGSMGTAPSSVDSLVNGLRRQGSGVEVSDPVTTTLGGLPATRIDVDLPSDQPRVGCRLGSGALQIWRAHGADYFVLFPDDRASLFVVDVAGQAQVVVSKSGDDVSAADRAELESVLGSIRFQR